MKKEIKDLLKNYIIFIAVYFSLAIIATMFFGNKLILSKSNLLVYFLGLLISFPIVVLIIYKKNK